MQTGSNTHDLWDSSDEDLNVAVQLPPQHDRIETLESRPQYSLFESSTDSDKSDQHSAQRESVDWRLLYLHERKIRKKLEKEVRNLQQELKVIETSLARNSAANTRITGGGSIHNDFGSSVFDSTKPQRSDGATKPALSSSVTDFTLEGDDCMGNGVDEYHALVMDSAVGGQSVDGISEEKMQQHGGVKSNISVASQQRARRAHAVRSRAVAASGSAADKRRTRILRSQLSHAPLIVSHPPTSSVSPDPTADLSVAAAAAAARTSVEPLPEMAQRSAPAEVGGGEAGGAWSDSSEKSFWDSDEGELHSARAAAQAEAAVEAPRIAAADACATAAADERGDEEQRTDARLRQWARGKDIIQLLNDLPRAGILDGAAVDELRALLPIQSSSLPAVRRVYL